MSTPSGASRRSIVDGLVTACREAGTTHVFGVPGGGSNLDLVGAAEAQGMRFVLVHTETAGAIMAGVMGELTGAPGMCLATRGPGATSAVNGAAQALLDRQPMVVVTDSVAMSDAMRVSHQRLDQQALMAPVTKLSAVLATADPARHSAVVGVALAAPPGPVHVDIDPDACAGGVIGSDPQGPIDLVGLRARLASARRPVVVVGVGAIAQTIAGRRSLVGALDALGAAANVPMLCTYKARGVVADSSSWCAGVATGATIESPVLDAADLMIGVGLDPVELIPAAWPYAAPIVLLGSWPIIDSVFFDDRLVGQFVGDLPELVAAAASLLESHWPKESGAGFRATATAEVLMAVPTSPDGLTPQQVVTIARAVAEPGTIATVDAGAHMFPAMHLWEVDAPGELLVSSGLATMGFALPAAIAASLARPDRAVVCFTGDGGIGMALAELETVARLGLPVIVVVFNDSTLSLIAAKQRPAGHGGAGAVTYGPTDFAGIARACGLTGIAVDVPEAYEAALRLALASRSPTLLDVRVDASAYGALLEAIRGGRVPAQPPRA